MTKDREPFEADKQAGETFQDPEPGGPSSAGNNRAAASPDDDVIELVDVVREGDRVPDRDADDALHTGGEEEDFLGEEDEELTDFFLPLEEPALKDRESDLPEPDPRQKAVDSDGFDFEAPEEEFVDHALDDFPEIPEEDLNLAMADLMEEEESPASIPEATEEAAPPISQERLEAVITRAVAEAVDRAVRETVADVAEKVIKEAIESLKQSLDTTPE